MPEFYWEIVQHDGTVTMIPPDGVEIVKRRMSSGEPINTRTAVIPANQIKSFKQTDKVYTTQPLLDVASQAFNEPQLNEDGSIVYKWVKKLVTNQNYNKHHSHIPSYRRLGEDNGMTVVAYKLPIHLIDINNVMPLTDEEVSQIYNKY